MIINMRMSCLYIITPNNLFIYNSKITNCIDQIPNEISPPENMEYFKGLSGILFSIERILLISIVTSISKTTVKPAHINPR
ncbi:hypothetical protein ES708_27755 [subsurface metagenome]